MSLKQSTAVNIPFWAGDTSGVAVTGKVTGDWTSTLSKSGGAQTSMTVTITELGLGFYYAALTTTHTNTVGWIAMTFAATGIQQVNERFEVEAAKNDDLSARIPAALVSGKMSSSIDAITAAIITSAAFATDAIAAAAVKADAVTKITSGIATATNVSAVTTAISALLPAALVGGRIDASVGAMASAVITASSIASSAFTAAKFATAALVNGVFGAGAIDAAVLASNTIAAAKIATGAITSSTFAAGAIDAAAIATDAIDADALKADAATEIATAVGAPSAATIAAAVAAPSAATITAAILAGVVDTGVTVKGVLARTDAAWRGAWTGLTGTTVTAYLRDGVTKAFEFTRNLATGARTSASTVNGD